MSNDIGIEELIGILNVDPEVDDHEPKVEKEQPDTTAVTAVNDLAAKFTSSLETMTGNQQLVFDSLLQQMEKNKAPVETAQAPAQVAAPVYVPNPALEPMKTFDPESYAVLIAKDRADFEANSARDQQMMAVINKQADQIDDLIKANNNNLGYMEESVVGAKHADAATLVKTPEFTSWLDSQNPIVKSAYSDVLEKGSSADRIQLIDMYKEQATTDKDAAVLAAATKGAEAGKAELPAPGSLTDFESSKDGRSNASLLDLAMDPDKIDAYLDTANGDPVMVQKLTDNLARAIAKEI